VTEPSNIVRCEVCDLPHNRGVEVCEECGHRLGTAPDLEALRRELPGLRGKIVAGFLVCAGMLALNVFLFGGVGYIIFLAPVAWTVFSIYRYRILSKRLNSAMTRGATP
jgi:hypothetical protein